MIKRSNEFKGFGLGVASRLRHVLRGGEFKGLGLGLGVLLRRYAPSDWFKPNRLAALQHACNTKYVAEQYDDFLENIRILCAEFPHEKEVHEKWLRRAMNQPDNEACRKAVEICAGVLGGDHPRVKKLQRHRLETAVVQPNSQSRFSSKIGADIQAVVDGNTNLTLETSREFSVGKERLLRKHEPIVAALSLKSNGTTQLQAGKMAKSLEQTSFLDIEEARVLSELSLLGDQPSLAFLRLIAGEATSQLARGLAEDKGYDNLYFFSAVEAVTAAIENTLQQPIDLLFDSIADIDQSAGLVRRIQQSLDIAQEMVLASISKDNPKIFERMTKVLAVMLIDVPHQMRDVFFATADRLPSRERAYLFAFAAGINRLSTPSDESFWALQNEWLRLFESVQNWTKFDLDLLATVSPLMQSIFKGREKVLLKSESLWALANIGAEDGGHPFFSQVCAGLVDMESISDLWRARALNYRLLVGEENNVASKVAHLNYSPKAPQLLKTLLSHLHTSDQDVEALLDCTDYFATAVVAQPSLTQPILRAYADLGGYFHYTKLLGALARLNKAWRADFEASAPRSVDGASVSLRSIREASSVLVVTDINPSAHACNRYKLAKSTTLYLTSGDNAVRTTDSSELKVLRGRTVNDDQRFIRKLTDLSETLAFSMTRRFLCKLQDDALIDVFNDLDAAFFATVRARLIGQFRRHEILNGWRAHSANAEKIILITPSSKTAAEVLSGLSREEAQKFVLVGMPLKLGAGRAFDQLFKEKSDQSESGAFDNASELIRHRGNSPSFENSLRDLTRRAQGLKVNAVGALFVIRLGAKTAPATVKPVIERWLDKEKTTLFNIQSAKDVLPSEYVDGLNSVSEERFSYLSSVDVSSQTAEVVRHVGIGDDPFKTWFEHEWSAVGRTLLSHSYERYFDTVLKNGIGFDVKSIAYLLSLRKTFDRLINPSKCKLVYVCPGRSVEAYAAQTIAGRRGVLSVDVTNAWLSDKYTYATPRGDIVTAIDQWTKELLRDFFQVPEECIKLTGTPRYDGLYARAAKMNQSMYKEKLGFDSNKPLICVALQPIDLELNLRIVQGVAEAAAADQTIQILVKPHPRESEERFQVYNETAAGKNSVNSARVRVLPKSDIIEALVACNVCITAFSNVGVEAALCQRDTILCRFDEMETPIQLDKMGLGYAVNSPSELAAAIIDTIKDGHIGETIKERRREFFAKNPHYIEGSATDAIFGLAKETHLTSRGVSRAMLLD